MSNGTDYLLRYRQGDGPWQEATFSGDVIIGRSMDSDITVDDERVSRKHVRLAIKPDGIWITDLGSSNGTRIGTLDIQSHTPHHLSINQQFFIGSTTLSVASPTAKVEGELPPGYILWYRQGQEPWKQYPFYTGIMIGRVADCDLQVDDKNISRRHARINIGPDGLKLIDLGSQNGTSLDDKLIPPQVPQILPLERSFSAGNFTFLVTLPGQEPPTAKPQLPIPPPVYAPELQPPPAFMPPPTQPPAKPPPQRLYPPEPPAKKGPGIWLIFAVGGLVVIFCIFAAVLAWFFYPVTPQQPDFGATQTAIQLTQLAIAGTPVAPSEQTPIPPSEIPLTPEAIPIEIPPTIEVPTPGVSPETQKWLVMVYGDADDSVLEAGMFVDLDEAEMVGSSDRVQIVWQLDRYIGAYSVDGDWTTTKRFFVTHDEELGHIGSQEIYDMGEANMGDPNTLVDFIIWAITTYPADKYVLIMSNHGSGWPGGWSDDDPVPDSTLWLNQIDDALAYVISQTSIEKFEMIGFDACLMGQLEVFSMIAPYARYGVASEETEPVLGWPYEATLRALVDNPAMNGADLASTVVRSYISDDIIVTNDYYRNMYTDGSDMEGAGPDEVAASELSETTMTAVDLSALPPVIDALNNLTYSMQGIDQKPVAEGRTYAQSYENVFSEEVPPPYIDLENFAKLVYDRSGSSDVGAAVDGLTAAISQAVLAEKHGDARPGSTGFSIYFPNSDLWQFTYSNEKGVIYTYIANRFANESLWDEFLEFHYTGNPF